MTKTILTALCLSLSLGVAGCDKKEEKKDDKKAEGDKKDEKKAEDGGEEKAAEEGGEEKAAEGGEEAAEGGEEAAADGGGDDMSTGIEECDQLWKRSMCAFEKIPDENARKTSMDAFKESAKAWQDMAKDEATKSAAQQACKTALDAGDEGWKAAGC